MDAVKYGVPLPGCEAAVGEPRQDVPSEVHLEKCVCDLGLRGGVQDALGVDLLGGDLAQLGGLDAVELEAVDEQVQSILVVQRGGRMLHECTGLRSISLGRYWWRWAPSQ